MEAIMSKSNDDLQEAFAGESQANRKYLAFAEKADEEGHQQAARLFRAAAHAETVHATNHFKALGGIQSTAENLQTAVQGENYEVTQMYPGFLDDAKAEGEKQAIRSFHYALEVEKIHEGLYKDMLASLGKSGEEYDYYVCPICGYTHARSAPDKCPICGTPKEKFERIH
jgi:rubrerythrin